MRHGCLRTFAGLEIQSRKDRGSDHEDIISKLFDVQRGKSKDFSEADVTSMAASNIMAGSDTTAISLHVTIHHLLKNREDKRQLLEEIDTQRKREQNTRHRNTGTIEGYAISASGNSRRPPLPPCGGHESSKSNTCWRY